MTLIKSATFLGVIKITFILPMVSELVSAQKVLGVQCETEDGKEDVVE